MMITGMSFSGIKYMGPNGKVNNIIKTYQASRYDLIVISDSSIKGISRIGKLLITNWKFGPVCPFTTELGPVITRKIIYFAL